MELKISCNQCGKKLAYPVESAGTHVNCSGCKAAFRLPRVVKAVPILPGASLPLPTSQGRSPSYATATIDEVRARGTQRSLRTGNQSGSGVALKLIMLFGGGAIVLGLLGLLVVIVIGTIGSKSIATLSPEQIPVPEFPEIGLERFVPGSNATYHNIQLRGRLGGPGESMQLRVYLPPGQHEPGSLACVLLAPAGTTLLHGNALDDDVYHDEVMPYLDSGIAVVFYSIDGPMTVDQSADEQTYAFALGQAFRLFTAAKAGVVNGRNALELVLQRFAQVDPKRIYSVGHSSAATLSLLLAAHEPRLAGAIAYAPITDLRIRLGELQEDRDIQRLLPGLSLYLRSGSPIHFLDRYTCPLFVFHARDDENEPFANTEIFVNAMKGKNAKLIFAPVPNGGHYQAMIDQGIPQAIKWIQANSR